MWPTCVYGRLSPDMYMVKELISELSTVHRPKLPESKALDITMPLLNVHVFCWGWESRMTTSSRAGHGYLTGCWGSNSGGFGMSFVLQASPSSSSDSFLDCWCVLDSFLCRVEGGSLAAFYWCLLPTEELAWEWCTFFRVDSTLILLSSPLSFLFY